MAEFLEEKGGLKGKSAKEQEKLAKEFVERIDKTDNKYIKGFNKAVPGGPKSVKKWYKDEGRHIVLKATREVPMTRGARVINGITKSVKVGGKVVSKGTPMVGGILVGGTSLAQGKSVDDAGVDVLKSVTGADIIDAGVSLITDPLDEMVDRLNSRRNQTFDDILNGNEIEELRM